MACSLGVGAGLTPPGHASVDEFGVAGQALVRAEAEAFGHTGAKAFEQRIGSVDKTHDRLDAIRTLQIDSDGQSAAVGNVLRRIGGVAPANGLRTLNPYDGGAHV